MAKLGLSEFANSFGNQHSGFSNLTGQVLNGLDTDAGPSGSSSGTGAAHGGGDVDARRRHGDVRLDHQPVAGQQPRRPAARPSASSPATASAPISASQDTAGPMERTVENVALNLQSTAGRDSAQRRRATRRSSARTSSASIAQAPDPLPNYLSALDPNFVNGKKIGYNGTFTPGTPAAIAFDALVAAGAIMVPRPQTTVPTVPGLPSGYQQHKGIDEYYKRLGPSAPIKSLVEEVADNLANAHEALKFGNGTHASAALSDVTPGRGERDGLPRRHAGPQGGPVEGDGRHDQVHELRSVAAGGSGARDPRRRAERPDRGHAADHDPDGLQRDAAASAERVDPRQQALASATSSASRYVIEQATQSLRQPASTVNPSMYRCAKTTPAPPFASRGGCNPDYETLMARSGRRRRCRSQLEMESAKSLQDRMTAGTLSAVTLTKAYLARIALSNAEGPAIQAVRVDQLERDRRGRGAGRRARDERRARAVARHPGAARRHDRRARAADDGGLDRAAALDAGSGLEDRREAQGGGGDHPRQDERLRARRRVRLEHARGLLVAGGPGAAAVRHRQQPRRLVRRLGGRDGVRHGGDDRRHGDRAPTRRADDRARRQQRRRGAEADGRARQPRGRHAGGEVAGLAGPDRADGLRRGDAAADARRRRSRRSRRRSGAPAVPNYLDGPARRPR